jgi:hypothetical protein
LLDSLVKMAELCAKQYGFGGSTSFWESVISSLLASAVIAIIGIVFSLLLELFTPWKIWTKLRNNVPDWFEYKTDNFFGVKWVWDWNKNSHQIVNIVPLCPECDYELDPCDRFPAEGLPGREVVSQSPTGFQCKKCGFKKRIPEYGDLDTLIPKEILYKIRITNDKK